MPRKKGAAIAEIVETPLGNQLRALIEASGLTVKDVAAKAGLSPDGVRNLLIGKATSPRATTLQRIADALGVPATRLMEGFAGDQAVPAPVALAPGWIEVPQVSPMDADAASLLELPTEGHWRMPEAALASRRRRPADIVVVSFSKRESPVHFADTYYLVDMEPGILPPRRGGWALVRDPGYGHALIEYRRHGVGPESMVTVHDADGREFDGQNLSVAGLVVAQLLG